jgi:hypothetical protein
MQETDEIGEKKILKTNDFLKELPCNIKKEITDYLLSAIHNCIGESLNAKNYKFLQFSRFA